MSDIEQRLREAMDGVTPGPWKVGACGDICHGPGDWNGLKIHTGWVEDAWRGDAEAEANARLLAAQARRAAIIEQQMKERKAKHRAWKYLEGEMMACKRAMLEAEIALRSPSLSKGA